MEWTGSTIAYDGTAHTLKITLGTEKASGETKLVSASALTFTLSGITDTNASAIAGSPFTSSSTKQF